MSNHDPFLGPEYGQAPQISEAQYAAALGVVRGRGQIDPTTFDLDIRDQMSTRDMRTGEVIERSDVITTPEQADQIIHDLQQRGVLSERATEDGRLNWTQGNQEKETGETDRTSGVGRKIGRGLLKLTAPNARKEIAKQTKEFAGHNLVSSIVTEKPRIAAEKRAEKRAKSEKITKNLDAFSDREQRLRELGLEERDPRAEAAETFAREQADRQMRQALAARQAEAAEDRRFERLAETIADSVRPQNNENDDQESESRTQNDSEEAENQRLQELREARQAEQERELAELQTRAERAREAAENAARLREAREAAENARAEATPPLEPSIEVATSDKVSQEIGELFEYNDVHTEASDIWSQIEDKAKALAGTEAEDGTNLSLRGARHKLRDELRQTMSDDVWAKVSQAFTELDQASQEQPHIETIQKPESKAPEDTLESLSTADARQVEINELLQAKLTEATRLENESDEDLAERMLTELEDADKASTKSGIMKVIISKQYEHYREEHGLPQPQRPVSG